MFESQERGEYKHFCKQKPAKKKAGKPSEKSKINLKKVVDNYNRGGISVIVVPGNIRVLQANLGNSRTTVPPAA